MSNVKVKPLLIAFSTLCFIGIATIPQTVVASGFLERAERKRKTPITLKAELDEKYDDEEKCKRRRRNITRAVKEDGEPSGRQSSANSGLEPGSLYPVLVESIRLKAEARNDRMVQDRNEVGRKRRYPEIKNLMQYETRTEELEKAWEKEKKALRRESERGAA